MCATPATHKPGWIRFQKYASLVREIIIDPLSRTGWDADMELLQDTFWCQLVSSCGDTPILPRLEGATVRSFNTPYAIDTGMLRLLNPSIRYFDVAFPQASLGELKQLGKALVFGFPWIRNLEVLSIEVQDLTPFLDMESLPNLHPRLRCIKTNRSAPVKLDSLCHLVSLPNLEILDINLRSWDPAEATICPMIFPRLRSLTCGGSSAFGVLVDHIHAPQLQTFSIYETHSDSNATMQGLSTHLRTLVTKCPAIMAFTWSSHQEHIRSDGYFGLRHAGVPLAELLAPLLSHRKMRRLTVFLRGPIVPCTPTDFRAIAEALPDLETFKLDDEGDKHYGWAERYADLESIAAFACHCPRLRSLHLPTLQFDPSSAPLSEGTQRLPAPHWLRELSIDHAIYGGEGGRNCRGEDVTLLRGLMEKVFHSARIRIRGYLATGRT